MGTLLIGWAATGSHRTPVSQASKLERLNLVICSLANTRGTFFSATRMVLRPLLSACFLRKAQRAESVVSATGHKTTSEEPIASRFATEPNHLSHMTFSRAAAAAVSIWIRGNARCARLTLWPSSPLREALPSRGQRLVRVRRGGGLQARQGGRHVLRQHSAGHGCAMPHRLDERLTPCLAVIMPEAAAGRGGV